MAIVHGVPGPGLVRSPNGAAWNSPGRLTVRRTADGREPWVTRPTPIGALKGRHGPRAGHSYAALSGLGMGWVAFPGLVPALFTNRAVTRPGLFHAAPSVLRTQTEPIPGERLPLMIGEGVLLPCRSGPLFEPEADSSEAKAQPPLMAMAHGAIGPAIRRFR